ncbi:hypothetical protein AMAG_19385 [Allomyces macrogynus ATCC 38327]|uniref:Uncharacterized protein n=1 Tax=Allomyces macrogynus (strain ATCC 38327) TaxID=578462 RepID=A0A0L0SV27_ALLM3|nr:hypothetical protein AMAG_19385 [Allomyces macrogynus ATCC 38327]|eukprot:KNE66316.1 hypothetical protein AMAG_19385 [Allomyces macrogynus ATCC 38327]
MCRRKRAANCAKWETAATSQLRVSSARKSHDIANFTAGTRPRLDSFGADTDLGFAEYARAYGAGGDANDEDASDDEFAGIIDDDDDDDLDDDEDQDMDDDVGRVSGSGYFDAHGWVPSSDRLSLEFVVPKSDPTIGVLATSGSPVDRAIFTYHALRQDPTRRGVYARFGATPLLACTYCRDSSDYALYALPDLLAPYLAALAVLGAATSAFRWQHWRRSALAALAALAVADFTARVGFRIPLGVLATWFPWLALRPDLVHYSVTQLQTTVFGVLAALLAMFPQRRLLNAGDVVQQVIAPKLIYTLQMAQSIPSAPVTSSGDDAATVESAGRAGKKQ